MKGVSALLSVLLVHVAVAAEPPTVYGPSLQWPSSTAMTVAFHLSELATAELHWGLEEPDENVLFSPFGAHHVFTIDGLEPDTEVQYTLYVDGQLIPPAHRFSTAPAPGTEQLSFLVIGDTRSQHDVHGDVVARMRTEEDVSFLVNTGDLVGDGEVRDQWQTFFGVESTLIDQIPMYPTVGNHEEHDGTAGAMLEFLEMPGGKTYYSADYGNVHVVVLDGHVAMAPACEYRDELIIDCLSDEQVDWLEEDLALAQSNPEVDHIFVFTHVGPYTSKPGRVGSHMMRALVPLFLENGVTALISGHDHYYERGLAPGDLTYIITGGGGAPLYETDDPCEAPHERQVIKRAHHYLRIDIDGCDATIVARNVYGDEFDRLTLRSALCEADAGEGADDDSGEGGASAGCSCNATAAGVGGGLAAAFLGLALIRRRYV